MNTRARNYSSVMANLVLSLGIAQIAIAGAPNAPQDNMPEQGGCPSAIDTMDLYNGLDLETNSVYEDEILPPEVDFVLAYNADWDAAVLFQQPEVSIAFLDETPFDEVNVDTLSVVSFSEFLIDEPLDYDDTVILHTADGNYFKIGNAELNADYTVTFDFEQLCEDMGGTTSDANNTVGARPGMGK